MISLDISSRFSDVMHRPGCYEIRTFEQAVAFACGFDAASEFSFLQGFREWLADKIGGEANLTWATFVNILIDQLKTDDTEPPDKMATLFSIIKEFLDERDGQHRA